MVGLKLNVYLLFIFEGMLSLRLQVLQITILNILSLLTTTAVLLNALLNFAQLVSQTIQLGKNGLLKFIK